MLKPILMLATGIAMTGPLAAADRQDPAQAVNPFIGTTNGGNVFPGAVTPYGMVAFSPEEVPLPGGRGLVAAPGGYEYRSNGVRGFGIAHLSGSGCAGAAGDVPVMPITHGVETSPSAAGEGNRFAAFLDHAKESATPGRYTATLGNGVTVALSATERTGVARFDFPDQGDANLLFRTSETEVGSSAATIRAITRGASSGEATS